MAEDPRERFERAITRGKLALLRRRAETLLDYADEGKIAVTPEERDAMIAKLAAHWNGAA